MKVASTSKHHPLHSQRRSVKIPFGAKRFLAVFEGFEGGFAVGASIVLALSFTYFDPKILLPTAMIGIIVNGFNTASVKFSSEHYMDELDGRSVKRPFWSYFWPALIEFVSYFAISFVTILPLIFIPNMHLAVAVTCIMTVALLFLAGWWRGYMLQTNPWNDARETSLLGLGIIIVGALSGLAVSGI